MRKAYKICLTVLFSTYFIVLIFIQICDLISVQNEKIDNFKYGYVLPFFEQNWRMFAPNPPMGNHYFLIKFQTNEVQSEVIDIHQQVRNNSFKGMFSIDQRIIKYFSECYNDIVRKKNKGIPIEENIGLSHGLESIVNYSKIILKNKDSFLKKINHNDSIFLKVYLIDEQLAAQSSESEKITKTYNELNKIFIDVHSRK